MTIKLCSTSSESLKVKLNKQPANSIVIKLTRSIGDTDITLPADPIQLTFTTANWNTYQNVAVSAAEDPDTVDGSATIVISKVSGLNTVNSRNVIVNEIDNDLATYTITATTEGNGSITPSGSVMVNHGDDASFSIVPDADYEIDSVTVDGVNQGVITNFSFTNVTGNHTIHAKFKIKTYVITASAGSHGAISPTGSVVVNHGADQTFNFSPAAGYEVDIVTVDGSPVVAAASYQFTNVTATHIIHVTFKIKTYVITASAGGNGTIDPVSATVNHGASQTFNFYPALGYEVDIVTVDGSPVVAAASYQFTNVTTTHTIHVTFKIKTYMITVTSGANGTVTPNSTAVNHGADQTFTFNPSLGYEVDTVKVDGSLVTPATSYQFTNVISAHTLHVTFKIKTYLITATSGANGTITPGSTAVNHGADQTFTFNPSLGYEVDTVTVDGSPVVAVASYQFTNVTTTHTIHVAFKLKTYTITASAGANGNINPNGLLSVNHGASVTYNFQADSGYQVSSVVVDSVSMGVISSYTFSNVTANHTISVSFQPISVNYTITASAGINGAISPSGGVSVVNGTSQQFIFTPDVGYVVDNVVVDGINQGAIGTYTFANVASDHTISVSFKPASYKITASAGSGGAISFSGDNYLPHGSNKTFTMTPNTGYIVDTVTVDSVDLGALSTYTFNNITADHTISVTFKVKQWTITAAAGSNGSITPSGLVSVNHGAGQSFVIAPAANYEIDKVMVDGVNKGAISNYIFTNVTADHTINATFKIKTYAITVSAGANGSITPNNPVTADHGSNKTFTITPNIGYVIDDVKVDGVSQGNISTYTFINVTSTHTISATFKIKTFTIVATNGLNGAISPSGSITKDYGSNQTFVITPSLGYQIDTLTVDSVVVANVSSYAFTTITANHTIHVTFKVQTYTIVASAGINGSISESGSIVVNYNDSKTFTFTADPGYQVANVVVDGINQGTILSYTFSSIAANHTISVSFQVVGVTYDIISSAGSHGSVSPIGIVNVASGDSQTFTIVADVGYDIEDVLVDSVSVGVVSTYTFTNVTANHTISASFIAQQHTITATAGANGSITPAGSVLVAHGSPQTFTIAPQTGYHIKDVTVNGLSVGAVASYTFTSVTSNHTISASFEINTYTITASAGANGAISPSGTIALTYNSSTTFYFSPNSGYIVDDVLIDGVSVGAMAAYTFSNISDSHTIVVSFTFDPVNHVITATSSVNGSISPAGAVLVAGGASQTFTFTPAPGYIVGDVIVDGVSIGDPLDYTFSTVVASHTINVNFILAPVSHTITASAGSNGSITPNGNILVVDGTDQLFTFTPNAGYVVDEIMVDGISFGSSSTYQFVNVTAPHTISVTFKVAPKQYQIKATAGAHGSISPFGITSVTEGADIKYIIIAESGYEIDSLTVDSTSVLGTNIYIFTNVLSDHAIHVEFRLMTVSKKITATTTLGGSISPSGAVAVAQGSNQTFTIKADPGYVLEDVQVDGVSQGAITQYQFINVQMDRFISASFVKSDVVHYVNARSSAGGSVLPAGKTPVSAGDSLSVSITPASGYKIGALYIDGIAVAALSQYHFMNVVEDHGLYVDFVPAAKIYTIAATAFEHGSISPQDSTSVEEGGMVTYSFVPDAGYQVKEVIVDGVSKGALSNYAFINVHEDHTITVSFEILKADSRKQLLSFEFLNLGTNVVGIISNDTITIIVPKNTVLSSLVASFTFEGSKVLVNNKIVISGVTSIDYRNKVELIVVAADGSEKKYFVTVLDASDAAVGIVGFDLNSYSVERGSDKVVMRLTRIGGSKGEATVKYVTQNDSAHAGVDFVQTSGTVVWADGDDDSKIIEIPLIKETSNTKEVIFTVKVTEVTGALSGSLLQTQVRLRNGSSPEDNNEDPSSSGSDGGATLGCSYVATMSVEDEYNNILSYLLLFTAFALIRRVNSRIRK